MDKTGNASRMLITDAQCRSARALVEMSRKALAVASSVSARTIGDFESRARRPIPSTLAAIRGALESAGVEFIAENGSGPGVRLRKAKP
jgi:transcriptional regulator with XRE-family HTH domain